MLRKILNDTKAKHPASPNELLYLPRTKGEHGFKLVEEVYKEIKIKTALHVHCSTDPAVKAAAKADLTRMQKGRSITRDANTFANKINVEISINQDEEWEIKFESQDKSTHLARGQTVTNGLTRARTEAVETAVKTQKWQGKLTNNRLNDENIGPHCLDLLTSWVYCPNETIRDVEDIYQRLVPTKVYCQDKLRYQIDLVICPRCKEQPETMAHIIAGCPALALNHYTA